MTQFCSFLWLTNIPVGFPNGSVVKNQSANAADIQVAGSIPGLERSPGGENILHSSILVLITPWTEEPGGLQSMGLQELKMTV